MQFDGDRGIGLGGAEEQTVHIAFGSDGGDAPGESGGKDADVQADVSFPSFRMVPSSETGTG